MSDAHVLNLEKTERECYYEAMIDRRDIEKLAGLAKIALSEPELLELRGQVDAILEHVSEIQQAGGDDFKPEAGSLPNIFREDGEPHKSGMFTDALLLAAPEREGKYVKVRKIL